MKEDEGNIRLAFMLLVLCSIALAISLTMVSALDIDNVKDFTPTKDIPDDPTNYGKIEITNAFGLGDKLAEVELKTNTYECFNEGKLCYASGTTNLLEAGKLIEGIRFEIDGDNFEQDIEMTVERDVTIEVKDFGDTCLTDSKNLSCGFGVIGSHNEVVKRPMPYNFEDLPIGIYNWEIKAIKKSYQEIEWVINVKGNELTEWALWSSNGGLALNNVTLTSPPNNYEWGNNSVFLTFTATQTLANIVNASLWHNANGVWHLNQTILATGGNYSMAGHNLSIDQLFGNDAQAMGIFFQVKAGSDIFVHGVNKTGNDNSTHAWIGMVNVTGGYNGINVSHANFTGNYAKFPSAVQLSAGTCYVLLSDSYGQTRNAWRHDGGANVNYPRNTTYFEWDGDYRFGIGSCGLAIGVAGSNPNDFYTFQAMNVSNLPTTTGSMSGTFNFSMFNTFKWNVQVYDSDGDEGWALQNFTVIFNAINTSLSYKDPVIEGDAISFVVNVTATVLNSLAGNLNYNGTIYAMTASNNATTGTLTRSINAPLVDANTNFTWSINYTINGFNYSTGSLSQYVLNIPNITINSSCSPASISFRLVDEENLSMALTGTFKYNFLYGGSNNTLIRNFGETTGTGFSLCINATIANFSIGEGEIHYSSPNYVERRYYIFSGTPLTAITNNITLFDLLIASQTSFKLQVEDTSLTPYVDKYTTLLRWYPNLNIYHIVDMGLTDFTGSTVIHVKTEDVDYRVAVYEKNGTLIRLDEPTRMLCLVNPCTYTLKVTPLENDFTSFLGIQYLLTFNQTTGIWNFVFSDSTQLTTNINLSVYRDTGTNSFLICSSNYLGFVGALSCNTSAFLSGIQRAVVVRSTSTSQTTLAQKIVTIGTQTFKTGFSLWLIFLIAIPIILFFSFVSPVGAIIGGVIALIPAFYFGILSLTVIGGVAILGAIVAHFLKRIS